MKKIYFLLMVVAVGSSSCKKDFLNTEPASGTLTEQQARDLQSEPAAAAKLSQGSLIGIYSYMRTFGTWTTNHDDFGQKAVDLGLESMTEDVVHSSHHWFGFDYIIDNRSQTFRRTHFMWNFYYKIILFSNSIIAQTDTSSTDVQVRGNYGQALALRGFAHHYLVQLFAKSFKGNESGKGIPIYTTTETTGKPRATIQEVYNQINSDLTTAVRFLQGYSRPNKQYIDQRVANGLLARAYMNQEKWAEAEAAAKAARTGYTPMSATAYKDGFAYLSNAEWMWGAEITGQTTSIFASFFSMVDNRSPGYAGALAVYKLISRKLYEQIPATDVRKSVFNDPQRTIIPGLPAYAQLKFVDANITSGEGRFTGDYLYMRAAEMYLIEAEAQARQGKDAAAAQTLFDLISRRDPSYTKTTKTGQALIDEIFLQKRIELWLEGQIFLDVKRMGLGIDRTGSNHRADAVLVIPAGDPKFTYQIPIREIESNNAISAADQNP